MTKACLLFACAILFQSCIHAQQPNIVHILADDLGWNDVSFHGSEVPTPHLDALAKQGAVLNQFYVQPTCTPTRAAMMTGRYPLRYGLHRLVLRPWHTASLPLEEATLPQILRHAGYRTAICGKWHLGMWAKNQCPMARGFDHQYGHLGGHLKYFEHTYYRGLDWHRDENLLQEEGYATELIGDEAIRLIQEHDGQKPFYLYLPFNAPHLPLQAPDPWLAKFTHIKPESRAKYTAMVACMDHQIGRVIETLKQQDLLDNTFVIFSSDNGGGPTQTHGADNAPLRGYKGQLYEGGVRVPALLYWPRKIRAGTTFDQPVHAVDLLPTLAAAAGIQLEPAKPIDGMNVLNAVVENKSLPEREIVLNTTGRRGAIRQGNWKLIKNGSSPDAAEPIYELFDLANDPREKTNLITTRPDIAGRLRLRLDHWSQQQQDLPGMGQQPEDWKPRKEWTPLPTKKPDPLALEKKILQHLAKSEATIDTIEIYGVRVNAERRFSYKIERYREHLFVRFGAGVHSGWAEMNLGENTKDLPFDKRIWRLQWFHELKGMRLDEALETIIAQRDEASFSSTECAEIALLDLAGKCLQVPALELLGLSQRKPVAGLYAILTDDSAQVATEAERAIQQNLRTHLKVKLYGKLDTDIAIIKAARQVMGAEAFLIGDANTGYRRERGRGITDLVPQMEKLHAAGLTAAEDPANLSAAQWAELARAVAPLQLCPDVPTRPAWKSVETLTPDMGDIFNMHPAGMGSLIQTVRLGNWIQSHNKRVMVGDASLIGPCCPVWQQVAIGLGADWVEAIEKPQENKVFQDCTLRNPIRRTQDGRFALPDLQPGFGVELDLTKLGRACYSFHAF